MKVGKGSLVGIDFPLHPGDGNVIDRSTLHFDVTVREVRPATADELRHGHVRGEGDHHP